MKTMQLLSDTSLLPKAQEFVREKAREAGLHCRQLTRLDICVEEIFLNLCQHAYKNGAGPVCITVYQWPHFRVRFTDRGPKFDPTRHPAPDVSATAAARPIGGLGIYMVKRYMQRVQYARRGRKNVLEITVE